MQKASNFFFVNSNIKSISSIRTSRSVFRIRDIFFPASVQRKRPWKLEFSLTLPLELRKFRIFPHSSRKCPRKSEFDFFSGDFPTFLVPNLKIFQLLGVLTFRETSTFSKNTSAHDTAFTLTSLQVPSSCSCYITAHFKFSFYIPFT